MNRAATIMIMLIAVSVSCNILEDRGGCPCLITIRTESLPQGADSACLYILRDTVPEMKAELGKEALERRGHTIRTSRRRHDLSAAVWCDTTSFDYPDFNLSGNLITSREGQDFPAVFMGKAVLYAENDTNEAYVMMHKRYAGIRIKIFREDEPTSICISYGNRGYRLDGTPSGGSGRFRPGFGFDGRHLEFGFRVPAQPDGLLDIEITGQSGSTTLIRLGEILAGRGYDWSAADLMDIEMTVAGKGISLSVGPGAWSDHAYDIAI